MGGFLEFVGNHIVASILGAIGVISYALGIAEQAQAIATRFKAWQLQALGAGFFFIAVVMVLVSFHDRQEATIVEDTRPAVAAQTPPEVPASLDPNVLPASVAQSYIDLMASDHTDLQEQRFLAPYEGKIIVLDLELASLSRQGARFMGQFRAGRNAEVFAYFSREWAEHLATRNVGESVRFQAKIIQQDGDYILADAKPL